MQIKFQPKWFSWGIVVFSLLVGGYWLYPYLLYQVMEWQKSFNLQLSGALNQLSQQQGKAGATLVLISFLYGIFHAVGPGHGKFILTSYLSLEQTKLRQAVKMSLGASLVQGFVAIILVSIIVVVFTLSRTYFNVTLQWVERVSFFVMIVLGGYWCYSAWRAKRETQVAFKIHAAKPMQKIIQIRPLTHIHHPSSESCSCGHQHLPSQSQMQKATNWKTQLLLVLSIGARPCSGAILVLFLSYTLNIYWWGMLSAIVMAVGTGLTLTLFALLVVWARQKAVTLSHWYLSHRTTQQYAVILKWGIGFILMMMGILLLHSSFIETTSGHIFKR